MSAFALRSNVTRSPTTASTRRLPTLLIYTYPLATITMIYRDQILFVPGSLIQLAVACTVFALTITTPVQAREAPVSCPQPQNHHLSLLQLY